MRLFIGAIKSLPAKCPKASPAKLGPEPELMPAAVRVAVKVFHQFQLGQHVPSSWLPFDMFSSRQWQTTKSTSTSVWTLSLAWTVVATSTISVSVLCWVLSLRLSQMRVATTWERWPAKKYEEISNNETKKRNTIYKEWTGFKNSPPLIHFVLIRRGPRLLGWLRSSRREETYSFTALYSIRDLSIQITGHTHVWPMRCRNFGGNFNSFMPFYSVWL